MRISPWHIPYWNYINLGSVVAIDAEEVDIIAVVPDSGSANGMGSKPQRASPFFAGLALHLHEATTLLVGEVVAAGSERDQHRLSGSGQGGEDRRFRSLSYLWGQHGAEN